MADRPCRECEKYDYDAEGRILRKPAGDPLGLPVLRDPGERPPCRTCPKIPRGLPARAGHPRPSLAVELTPENKRCLEHYLEAREVGYTEDERRDRLVRRNARTIGRLYEAHDRDRANRVVAEALRRTAQDGSGSSASLRDARRRGSG